MHLACENGLADLVKLLLEKRADPNIQTSNSTNAQTPLHKAILNNHENVVKLFLKHYGIALLFLLYFSCIFLFLYFCLNF